MKVKSSWKGIKSNYLFYKKGTKLHQVYPLLEPLDFLKINQTAQHFADHIESIYEELSEILLEYESYEVVEDEISRALDLLRNLKENKKYFHLRIGPVTSFLPRNQPLYALTCFAIVPSLMASEVHFRIPHSMRLFFPSLLDALLVGKFFPNIFVSHKERLEFLRERSALRLHPKTQESWPLTDVVIFTGTSTHADRLRLVFDNRTLFIANGSGHNPVVVAEDADVQKAVEATLKLQLYNQGQDCAAPNAILVHKKIFHLFLNLLHKELYKMQVGHYKNRLCSVGPISEPEDLVRIQNLLVENRKWLDSSTPGTINSQDAIVAPTIICKPLKEGGNFTEIFAPIIFLQEYEKDQDLCLYFGSPHYARNAMYISIYGTSQYVNQIINKKVEGKMLHDSASVLRNNHLHAPGIERGTQPYGGYGYGASSLSINGKIICKPTLPQRDIYEWIGKPLMDKKRRENHKAVLRRVTKIYKKDVQKLLGLKVQPKPEQTMQSEDIIYVDLRGVEKKERRYVSITKENTFRLLNFSNTQYIATLKPKDLQLIRSLRAFLMRHKKIAVPEFSNILYSIAKKSRFSESDNRINQLKFFTNIYHLLFGKEYGPRLAHFLVDADRGKVCELLKV